MTATALNDVRARIEAAPLPADVKAGCAAVLGKIASSATYQADPMMGCTDFNAGSKVPSLIEKIIEAAIMGQSEVRYMGKKSEIATTILEEIAA